jgi:hypothetical protein
VSLPKFVPQSANLPLSDQSCPVNVPAGSADNSAGTSADNSAGTSAHEEETLSSADSGKFPAGWGQSTHHSVIWADRVAVIRHPSLLSVVVCSPIAEKVNCSWQRSAV